MQILLKQSPAAVEKLAEIFHLTEGEKFLLLESDVGEGLFFAGSSHVAIKVVASYAEDQIITTDPRELLAKQSEQQEADMAGQAIEAAPQQFQTQSQTAAPVAQPNPQSPAPQAAPSSAVAQNPPVAAPPSVPQAQNQPTQPPAQASKTPNPPQT